MDPTTKTSTEIITRIPDRLAVRTLPERWQFGDRGRFCSEMAQVGTYLVEADREQYPAGGANRPYGTSMARLLRRLAKPVPGAKRVPLHLTNFGGVNFHDPFGSYTQFWQQLMRRLLAWTREHNSRLRLGTGGGPGFSMHGVQEVTKAIAHDMSAMDIFHPFQVLAKIGHEQPNRLAGVDWTVRPQAHLGVRREGLIIPSDVLLCNPFGLGGLDELAGALLNNQLGGLPGPFTPGPRLVILLDAPSFNFSTSLEDSSVRWWDWFEMFYQTTTLSQTTKPSDFRTIIRVSVREDPTAAADRVFEDIVHWTNIRDEHGVRDDERRAICEAMQN